MNRPDERRHRGCELRWTTFRLVNDERRDRRNERTSEVVQTGSDVVGAAVGGTIGLLGGPVFIVGGAVGGVLVTRAMRSVGQELQARLFGMRQQVRVS
jgi:hypothetical protein